MNTKQRLMEELFSAIKTGKQGVITITKQLKKKVPELCKQLIMWEIVKNLLGIGLGFLTMAFVRLIIYLIPMTTIDYIPVRNTIIGFGTIISLVIVASFGYVLVRTLVAKDIVLIEKISDFVERIKRGY